MDVKTTKIGLEFKNKKIWIECKDCNIFQKMRGLMFRKKENAQNLLFQFSDDKNIGFHSFFVFFHFVILWVNKDNKIIDYREVYPWKFKIKTPRHFAKVIEIPINNKNSKVLEELHKILVEERKI